MGFDTIAEKKWITLALIFVSTIFVLKFSIHTTTQETSTDAWSTNNNNFNRILNSSYNATMGRNIRRRERELRICQLKQVLIQLDSTLDLEVDHDRTWHCIEDKTENIYEIENLPLDLINRYEGIFKKGNTRIELEGEEVDDSFMKISIKENTNIRILNKMPSFSESFFPNTPKETIGSRKVLIARVSSIDCSFPSAQEELSDSIFGTNGDIRNLKNQYEACSYGKLEMMPAEGSQIEDGVVDVRLMVPIKVLPAVAVQSAAMTILRAKLGPLHLRFDHVMLCLPSEVNGNWVAYAYLNGVVSVYKGAWCSSVSTQMHEIGHNLGLDHSGLEDDEYGDTTGMMGFSYKQNNWPRKCFNAAKSWNLGWYKDRNHVLNTDTLSSWSGKLIGVPSYNDTAVQDRNDLFVIIKLQSIIFPFCDIYIMFNEKKGINWDTSQYPNAVTIVKGKARNKTTLLKGLSSGESSKINLFGVVRSINIEVCSIVGANPKTGMPMVAEISIYKGNGSTCNHEKK